MGERDIVRHLILRPYRHPYPAFSLRVWDTHRTQDGKSTLGYELRQRNEKSPSFLAEAVKRNSETLLFQGEDFHASPLHAIDSDATMGAILAFLTLRPGEPEYFANYNDAQRQFCEQHAEALAAAVYGRFGDV